jgi:hypothetical protein
LGLVLTALLALLVIVLVGPWPRRVRRENTADYDEAGRELIRSGPQALAPGPLRAGRASRCITPGKALPLAGYPERGGTVATGVAQDLYVKALALGNGEHRVLLLSVDQLLLPASFVEKARRRLAEQTGWRGEEIVFTVTHTHSAPSVWPSRLAGRVLGGRGSRAYAREVSKALAQAGLEAVETMQSSFWASFEVDASDLVRGRQGEAVDGMLRGLLIRHLDGNRTVLLNFGASPCAMPRTSRLVSGDYPGYLQEKLEGEPGVLAMFQIGAALGASPVPPKVAATGDQPPAKRAAALIGQELSRRVRKRMDDLVCKEMLAIGVWAGDCRLPSFSPRLADHWQLSPAVPWSLGVRNHAAMQVVMVGDVLLATLPMEFPASAYRQMAAGSRGGRFWLVSLSGGYQGYASNQERDGLVPWCGPRSQAAVAALLEDTREAAIAVPVLVVED